MATQQGGNMKRLLKKMQRKRTAWICTLLVTPMPAGVTLPSEDADSSGVTTVTFGAGGGSYRRELLVYGGFSSCSGNEVWIPVNFDSDFVDAGGEIDHQFSPKGHFGVRGGYIRERAALADAAPFGDLNTDSIGGTIDPTEDYVYVNPFISYEGDYFGAGIGVIYSSGALRLGDAQEHPVSPHALPSFHLRVGSLSEFYGLLSFGESVPLYSGGAMFRAGLGIQPVSYFDAWGGIGFGPWPGRSYLLSLGLHPSQDWSINTNFRLRSPDDQYRELGASVSFTYRFGN